VQIQLLCGRVLLHARQLLLHASGLGTRRMMITPHLDGVQQRRVPAGLEQHQILRAERAVRQHQGKDLLQQLRGRFRCELPA
jgi:hypothetical protein